MRRPGLGFVAFTVGLLGLGLSGCGELPVARYVYQDGEFGVVAIPVNTSLDRVNYRAQAEELMARHFPEGYEIVRAEEVNEGERTLDVGKKTEVETDPSVRMGSNDQARQVESKHLVRREAKTPVARMPDHLHAKVGSIRG